MRGFLAFLFLALVALGAGAFGYQAGASSATTAAAAAGGASVVYVGGWHLGGLLVLPFLFLLVPLFLFTFLGFMAFVFGGRRRHWAANGPAGMHGGPAGGRMDDHDPRRQWIVDMHRQLHETDAGTGTARESGSTTGATPGDGGPAAG